MQFDVLLLLLNFFCGLMKQLGGELMELGEAEEERIAAHFISNAQLFIVLCSLGSENSDH